MIVRRADWHCSGCDSEYHGERFCRRIFAELSGDGMLKPRQLSTGNMISHLTK
ncbi:putative zinc ribbon protein [Scandinavium sp. UTDF21-P1B]|uniref:putative zinc ribbon protein n=1 Tax=Scandinavium sp. UTDF21-P1B TaxID=3446379 RepID=UPI003F53AF94